MTHGRAAGDCARARAARRVALAALAGAAAAGGCAHERISSTERYVVPSRAATIPVPAGAPAGESPAGAAPIPVRLSALAEIPWNGRVLPITAPDGSHAATETGAPVPWAVRVGDPLPPSGIDCKVEVIELAGEAPGSVRARLPGPWILGRSARSDGFPVERPRADGGRELAFSGWDGAIRTIASDGWCNAHAAAADPDLLAWSRRRPEGGDWQLVAMRGNVRRVLEPAPGSSLLAATFSGDGRGVFAIELLGNSASLAWIPFGEDGLPSAGRSWEARAIRSPVSARANLSWAIRATDASSGGSGSPEGTGRLAVWNPDLARMVAWLPGSEPDQLLPGSLAAIPAGTGDAIVTTDIGVFRERIGARREPDRLTDVPWVLRPLGPGPGVYLGLSAAGARVRAVRLSVGESAEPAR